MLHLLVLAAAVAAVPAAAAVKMVTITKDGFVPADLTVAPGDSVAWTNSDTVAHQVVFDKAPCNLVVQPRQAASCTFPTAGSFNYRDPSQRGAFRGVVRVGAPAAAVTIAASAATVAYAAPVALSGALTTGAGGETLTVLAQPHGASSFTQVGTVATAAGGAYSFTVKPALATTYQVRAGNIVSSSVKVSVRPGVGLAVVSARTGVFAVQVTTRRALVGKTVDFQRRNAYGQWVTLKRVALKGTSSPTVAAARIGVQLPAGTSVVRVTVPAAQAGAGYLAGVSPLRTVRR